MRGRTSSPKIGIFETGTHRVVDIPRCVIHHPLVNEVAAELRRAIVRSKAAPYSDEAHRGLVRYLQVVVERSSRSAQVVVVANADGPETSGPLLSELSERLGPRLHSLFWNGNPERTNTILGPRFHRVSGPSAVEERIGGARVFYPPGAFGQSNLPLADSVVRLVHEWVPDGARMLELYAGVGAIGLGLVPRSLKFIFNEVARNSLEGLELGLAALPDEFRSRCSVAPGPAENVRHLISESDVVIADPPRKGLDRSVREALVTTPPRRFVYIACGLPAFLDDARVLVESSTFRLADIVCFDLFPYTEHVEVVARFERADETDQKVTQQLRL